MYKIFESLFKMFLCLADNGSFVRIGNNAPSEKFSYLRGIETFFPPKEVRGQPLNPVVSPFTKSCQKLSGNCTVLRTLSLARHEVVWFCLFAFLTKPFLGEKS